MTDLLHRPVPTSSAGSEPPGRPLVLSAALASLAASATGLLTAMGLAVVGWFLADAGAHGQTTDALRVGADLWLVGHGSGLAVGGVPLGVTPLALTASWLLVAYRLARWAGHSSAPPAGEGVDRTVVTAAAVFAGVYVVVAVVTCLVAATGSISAGLGRTVLGSLSVAAVGGALGLGAGSGRLRHWVALVPRWVRATCFGAAAGALLLVAAASVLVTAAVALGLNEASAMMSQLRLGTGDIVTYAVASALFAPNAVALGAAYLLGPGFAVGVGTAVSPSVVVLGQVPAFPMVAALPGSGTPPEWMMGLVAVPVLAGAAGAVLAQRAYRVPAWDSAALRGFGSGLGAALLLTLLAAVSGGPLGTGRMAQVGASAGEVFVAAALAMSGAGLVAASVTAWLQRRADRRADRSAEAA